jgi:hypothetical protein
MRHLILKHIRNLCTTLKVHSDSFELPAHLGGMAMFCRTVIEVNVPNRLDKRKRWMGLWC